MQTAPDFGPQRERAWDYIRFKVPPPVAFAVLTGAGIALHLLFPVRLMPYVGMARAAGLIVFALGVALTAMSIITLKRAGTDEKCLGPTTTIVHHGPYKWSRNPMYIGVMLWMVGLSLAINTIWILALVPVYFVFVHFLVVSREEQYLVDKFGEEYRDYQSRVRRWI